MRQYYYLLSCLLFFAYSSNLKSQNQATFNYYKIDHSAKMIIVNVKNLLLSIDPVFYLSDKEFIFVDNYPTNGNVVYNEGYTVKESSSNTVYILYFSQLPIIEIQTDNQEQIQSNVNYLLAQFTYKDAEYDTYIQERLAIRQRGGSTRQFPKVSYRLEFREKDNSELTKDIQFPRMQRKDDDWNLQALYNERLRLRNKVNFELWELIHPPYYQNQEPKAKSGVAMEYADVFINDKYWGIYCLSERIDRKQLKLKKYNDQIHGELYRGSGWGNALFRNAPDYINGTEKWGSFEYKYPNEIVSEWENLYSMVSFVVNSESDVFESKYPNHIHVDNFIDYFIFMNLLRITDNTGNNLFIARYDKDEPYFYVPWDLDLSFGYVWCAENELLSERKYAENILSNNLYDKLRKDNSSDGFIEKYFSRWTSLRENIITTENILSIFKKYYNYLYVNGAYHRENKSWPKSFSLKTMEDEMNYLEEWIEKRIKFLDKGEEVFLSTDKILLKYPSIFYNPFNNCLQITEIPSPGQIQIFNLAGECIQKTDINKEGGEIFVRQDIPLGMYIAKISSQDFCYEFKFIK